MMIFSTSLTRRMQAMMLRSIGSNATLTFYEGPVPADAEAEAGARIARRDVSEAELAAIIEGKEPERPSSATCWRLHDIGALVLIQGDWK